MFSIYYPRTKRSASAVLREQQGNTFMRERVHCAHSDTVHVHVCGVCSNSPSPRVTTSGVASDAVLPCPFSVWSIPLRVPIMSTALRDMRRCDYYFKAWTTNT